MFRLILPLAFLLPCLAVAQSTDVQLSQRVAGDTLILLAENTSEQDLDLDLTLKTRGFGRMPSEEIAALLPARSTVELIRLPLQPGKKQTYTTEYRYVPRPGKAVEVPTDPAPAPDRAQPTDAPVSVGVVAAPPTRKTSSHVLPAAGDIVVYTQPGCPRCAATVKMLDEERIAYTELDADENSTQMFDLLRSVGFRGGSVQMPVVRIGDETYYSIKDLYGFLEALRGSR